ncbi:MAG: choice-of-anchor D domain-containing protein [Candidatus Cloacimonetes bacterium]|nr:choice-of-anchor D domain-containing protein [Candidatus Cloacimonadota bacterium]
MKKISIVILLICLGIGLAFAQITTFPWNEGFEGTFLPAGWTKIVTTPNDITQSNTQNHTPGGVYSARFSSFSTSTNYNQYLFSPAITVDAAYTMLSFWHRKYGTHAELLEWGIATDTSPGSFTWTPVTLSNLAWQETMVDLSAYAGDTVYLGFHYYGNYLWYVYLDDVAIEAPPTVPVFTINPESWDFGNVDTVGSVSKTFTVANDGGGELGIVSIEKSDGDVDYFEIVNNTYTGPLGLGESFTFDVEFSPTEEIPYTLTLSITDDQAKVAHDVIITGMGYSRPPGSTCQNPLPVELPLVDFLGDTALYGDDYSSTWITPSSSYLNGDDMVLQFTLAEASKLVGTLTATTGSWIGMFVVNTTPDPVTPAPVLAQATSSGTVATMDSEYLPAGSYFLLLSTYPSPQSFQFSLDLEAVPAPTEPIFSIDPESWDFGNTDIVGSVTKTFTVSNEGGGELGIVSIEKSDGDVDYFEIVNNTYTAPLGVGESFTFGVEFSPTEEIPYTLTLSITDDQAKATHDVIITGMGYTRPPGSTCQNPLPVELPLVGFEGDTSLYGDDYSSTWITPSSSYLNGDDMVLQFTLEENSILEGTLTALTGNWIGMFVVNTTPDPVTPAPVLAQATSSGTLATMESGELAAGSYFLILSTYPSPQSFTFSLDLMAIPANEPLMFISEDYWDYGVALAGGDTCTPHTFAATNVGFGTLTIAAPPVIEPATDFSIIDDTNVYPITLGSDASAYWTVKFNPSTPCGEKTATMTLVDDIARKIALVEVPAETVVAAVSKSANGEAVSVKSIAQENNRVKEQPKNSYEIGLRGYAMLTTFEDNFEGYADFTLDLTPWTQVDLDGSDTYYISNTTFPNQGYIGSFIAFNPSMATPALPEAYYPYSGEKYAACFAATDFPNDDWLVSPPLSYTGEARFSMLAKSITSQYGLERMMIAYSTEGNDPTSGNWTYLLGSETEYAQVPVPWTLYEYALPSTIEETTVYIAIHCVSYDAFILMIDDFVFGSCFAETPVELSSFTATVNAVNNVELNWVSQSENHMNGYRVYRNTSADQSGSIGITPVLIPATNTSTTHTYSVIDNSVEIGATYYYWLEAVDYQGSNFHGPVSVTVTGNVPPVLPEITSMKNAYPNPFKASANIEVSVKAGETGSMTIYNVAGKAVRTYNVTEGIHNLIWDGKDSAGKACGSGIYFYKLATPSFNQSRKLMLVK